jgi:PKD repeat protein
LKTLNIIYILRVVFGIIAALIAALVVNLKVGTPLINGISVALAVYLVTFYLVKWKFMNKVEKPTKIFTMGIGAYFLAFILFWVLFITPFLAAPTAAFVVNPENRVVAEPIEFNANLSEDPDGYIVKYIWSFGDDDIIEEIDPEITHTYYKPQNYTVILTVVDDNGISISTSNTFEVVAPS